MTAIAVVIPVGPREAHCRYLGEALDSIHLEQTRPPDFAPVLVDDMHRLSVTHCDGRVAVSWVVENWWRLGVGAAFNVGVGWAMANLEADLIVMLGADDRLEPGALERLEQAYEEAGHADGFYWFDVRYSDGREDQHLACHAAAVTPGMWRETGGFTPEMCAGMPDAALISAMLVNRPHYLHEVQPHGRGEPLYWHRVHEGQATADGAGYSGTLTDFRGDITAHWRPAGEWGAWRDSP